jgi:hypothetical protein
VLVLALVIGGIALAFNSGGGDTRTAPGGGTPAQGTGSGSASGSPATAAARAGAPSASASGQGEDLVRYVVLKPGQCFDHPGLDSSVTQVTAKSCTGSHDGEVIANETLTGAFSTSDELRAKVLKLCEVDAKKRMESIPNDGRDYFYYAIYPSLATYQGTTQQGTRKDTISCGLTVSNKLDGKKLTKPLP